MFVYSIMALASAVGFIWKHPLNDLVAKTSAPIGAAFTFLALVTGSRRLIRDATASSPGPRGAWRPEQEQGGQRP